MRIYKTQEEVNADVKDGMLVVDEDVRFEFSLKIEASLKIKGDISAGDISAWDISARNISFWAVAFAYVKFVCKSIKGTRENAKYFCLDNEIVIKGEGK